MGSHTEYGWTLASHNSDKKFCFGIESKAGSGLTYLKANEEYELNKWYHVAGTYDGNTMTLYVDGIYVNSSTEEIGDIDYTDSWFRIGMYKDDDENIAMDGQIDEVRIWNVARTQAEIQANMYTALQGNESGLVAYYDFEEGFGTTLNNKAANNKNHGTLTNMDNDDWVRGIIVNNLTFTITKGTSLNTILSGYDADNDALTYSIVNNPSKGTVSHLNPSTGAFTYTYTSDSNHDETDSFTYRVYDGTNYSDAATVNINVISISRSVSTFAELKDAILTSNKHDATFTITFENDITITEHLPLIESDIQFIGNEKTIDGGGQQQVFFVKSGIVSFSNLTIQNGLAKGGNGGYNAGGGAGMGGAIFVNENSTVTVDNVTFSNNQAIGGEGGSYNNNYGSGGGGGFGGNGSSTECDSAVAAFYGTGGGGGGLFADANGGDGGNNPNSAQNGIDGSFGQGGGGENNGNGGVGGDFGGGAGSCAGAGADGGFGGGGASATDYAMGAVTPQSGKGGIFGGGGGGSYSNIGGQFAGDGQTKGGGGGGAGLGGAIFVRKAGKLTVIGSTLIGSTFKNNSANGGTGTEGGGDGQGKGGAIFVQEGATVIVEGKLTFEGNTAEDDEASTTDNDDVYGIITPTVKITASGGNPTEEKQTSADFTVSRAMGYEESTVYFFITGTATFNNDYTIENATTFDGISGMGTVTIPKNNQETSIKLKITPKDDDFVDPNETISITLYPGTGYKMSETEKTATLVIKDNDYHQVATALSLETNHAAILDKGSLTISGKLSRFPYDKEKHDLSGEQVTLTVIAPDGTFLAKGEDCPFKKTLTEDEQFIISGLEKEGTFSYTFSDNSSCLTHQAAGGKYTFKASFAGNLKEETGENLLKIPSDNNLEAIEPEVSVLVGPSAGYVLLIQGQIASDPEGSTAYNKTTNRIYQKLIDRGFDEENISYFNFNPEQSGVDGIPERQAIETALFNLKGSFNESPAPLYIIMVNHGGKEGDFYIDNGNNEKITANDLSDWMNRFEEGLDAAALKQPRIAIIGACYSGSFIKSLSKAPTIDNNSVVDAGRIIITSASAEEESYKGPQEEYGIRSGEFFMEELFQQLGRGESLKTSFEYAVERTETLTHRDDANATEPFYDQAAQHPLLDDNGDRVGSNALFMGQNQDGQIAQNTYLGGGQQDPDEAIVTEVTHSHHLFR